MDQLRAAAPLARALLTLAQGQKSGVLRVRASGRLAFVWLSGGKVVRLDGVDGPLLGDTLLGVGALDVSRHKAALSAEPPKGPVGKWLVATGLAPLAAVEQALAGQLTARLKSLLEWPSPSFAFSGALRRTGDALLDAALAEQVWLAMVQLAAGLDESERALLNGAGPLRLTSYGTRLIRGALANSFDPAWLTVPGPCERAALCVLGLAVPTQEQSDGYSLLLRKRRQVARRAAPWALLDLPHGHRPEQARRALRALARRLHPDRFATAAPELRALSGEVLRALVHAEQTLRSAR